jgi:hypothetical protein
MKEKEITKVWEEVDKASSKLSVITHTKEE